MLPDFLAPLAPVRSPGLLHTSSTRYGIHRRGMAKVLRADERDPQIGKVTSMAFFVADFSGEKDDTFYDQTEEGMLDQWGGGLLNPRHSIVIP